MNHYSSGMVTSTTLDASLNNSGVLGIPLSESEKSKMIAFLKTLTDNEFLTNQKFAEY
jgi:cytochrome c peroxidase